jgi:hypothetical protein
MESLSITFENAHYGNEYFPGEVVSGKISVGLKRRSGRIGVRQIRIACVGGNLYTPEYGNARRTLVLNRDVCVFGGPQSSGILDASLSPYDFYFDFDLPQKDTDLPPSWYCDQNFHCIYSVTAEVHLFGSVFSVSKELKILPPSSVAKSLASPSVPQFAENRFVVKSLLKGEIGRLSCVTKSEYNEACMGDRIPVTVQFNVLGGSPSFSAVRIDVVHMFQLHEQSTNKSAQVHSEIYPVEFKDSPPDQVELEVELPMDKCFPSYNGDPVSIACFLRTILVPEKSFFKTMSITPSTDNMLPIKLHSMILGVEPHAGGGIALELIGEDDLKSPENPEAGEEEEQ